MRTSSHGSPSIHSFSSKAHNLKRNNAHLSCFMLSHLTTEVDCRNSNYVPKAKPIVRKFVFFLGPEYLTFLQLPSRTVRGSFARVSAIRGRRQSNRATLERTGQFGLLQSYGPRGKVPCLIVNRSQDGFGLVVGSRLQHGKLVDLILDEEPSKPVRCRVAWIGEPGSKQQGCAGLQPWKSEPGLLSCAPQIPVSAGCASRFTAQNGTHEFNAELVASSNQFLRYRLARVSALQRHG